jgi:O-antigen/teichoic acid export membrane protein
LSAAEVPLEPPAGGGKRLTAITIDQGISAASNVLTSILAARVLSSTTFGIFTVAYLTYITTQGITRALVGEPLLVRPQESRDRPAEAIGSAFVVGLVVGAVVALVGLVALPINHDLGTAFLVLGACNPLLVLQDLGRYLAFATHRPARAIALDVGWLVLLLGAVTGLAVADAETLGWFILAWAGTGALASVILYVQYRGIGLDVGVGWLRETWAFSWRYAMSFASRQGSVLLASSSLGLILGAKALGSLNGALLLFGPLVQLQTAAVAAGVAEVSHLPVDSPKLRRHLGITTAFTTTAAVGNVVVALILPGKLGRLVLGDTWAGTRHLLGAVGVQMILIGLVSGARSVLLGVRALRRTLQVDIATSVINLTATLVAAVAFGRVLPTVWALAAAQGVIAVLWWAAYLDHERHPDRVEHSSGPVPASA